MKIHLLVTTRSITFKWLANKNGNCAIGFSKQGNSFNRPPIPNPANGVVTSEAFAAALRRTIDQLQHEADSASVTLPPQYGFSFEAERTLVKFAPGSLEPLAEQLGEVKTIQKFFMWPKSILWTVFDVCVFRMTIPVARNRIILMSRPSATTSPFSRHMK